MKPSVQKVHHKESKHNRRDRTGFAEKHESRSWSVPGSQIGVSGVFLFEFVHEGNGEVLH